MSQHYSDLTRESNPHALPDVETFKARIKSCPVCDDTYPDVPGDRDNTCCHSKPYRIEGLAWWYWFCSPGCLPDSDPIGPFATEAEALEDVRGDV